MVRVRWQAVKLLISPSLYFAGVVPVAVGIFVVFGTMEYGGRLEQYGELLYRYDNVTPSVDEVGLAFILVIGGLVFGLLGRTLISLERLGCPKLTDHLRRCTCFYLFLVIATPMLIQESVKAYRVPGYPPPEFLSQVAWLLAGCAILMDALLLVWRRRFNGVHPRSAA